MANISTIKVGDTSYGITATPTAHASTATTYGAASASNYGHVKLSDNYTSSAGAAASGIGASSKAVYDCYNTLNSKLNIVYDTFSNSEYLIDKVYAYKYGKICQLSYSGDTDKIDKDKIVELFILPERYRPTQRIVSKIRAFNSDFAWLFVNDNGLVQYYSHVAIRDRSNFQFNVMYLTNK